MALYATRAFRALATLLLAGVLGAALVRMAPGSDVDARELDPRLSRESIEALRRERAANRNPLAFYIAYLGRLVRGDAGISTVFNQPVAGLIAERFSTTVKSVSSGLTLGWVSALAAAAIAARGRPLTMLSAVGFSGGLLSCPSAVLAVFCLLLGLPPFAAIAAIVFPRVFSYSFEQFRAGLQQPFVLMARARGIAGLRLFLWHVVPVTLAPLIALAGVTITLAAGAAIPVEALADSAGVGHLAWSAALGRDVPLLVATTLTLACVTVMANLTCDLLVIRLEGRAV